MSDNTLNIVISLVFIYLLYSLFVTTINELIASYLSFRAKMLYQAVCRMLTDGFSDAEKLSKEQKKEKSIKSKVMVDDFYGQPSIKFLGKDNGKPAYLTAASFVKGFLELCRQHAANEESVTQKIKAGITAIKGKFPQTGAYLENLMEDAQGDVEKFKELLEQWFNETMDRATGWYKRKMQVVTLIVAFTVTTIFNINTIAIVNTLSANPKLAKNFADSAQSYVKSNEKKPNVLPQQKEEAKEIAAELNRKYEEQLADLSNANAVLGLGWDIPPQYKTLREQSGYVAKKFFFSLLGFIITTVAISLGAPFWFDLLGKLIQIRSSKKAEETPAVQSNAVPALKRVG